jgi:hypothetical protein
MEESEARQWLGEALSIFSDIAEAYGRMPRLQAEENMTRVFDKQSKRPHAQG